jgi:WD40 repeat protein
VAEVKASVVRAVATLAMELANGVVVAQHVVRLEPVATLTVPGGVTTAAAFAPDGRSLATASERGDVWVLELPARVRRWTASPSDHWVGELAYSPDGRVLACCGRHLTLHDAATGREIARVEDTGPCAFAWNVDGTRYAYWSREHVVVCDAMQHTRVASFPFEDTILELAFAADGTLHAGDSEARLWRIRIHGEA